MAALNVLTLTNGHNWGGDFAQYIIHAQNILQGKPYTQGIMLEKTIVYPPGFPLLIAPLIKFWGVHFETLKLLNIACWFGAVFFIWLLAKDRLSALSAYMCALLAACSSFFFIFKQNILSDIPFMLFTMASVWALERRRIAWVIPLLMCAVLTRSAGLMICAAALFYFLAVRRDLRIVGAVVLSALASLAVQYAIVGGVYAGFWRTLAIDPGQTLTRLAQGASTVWQSIIWALCPGLTQPTSFLFTGIEAVAIILSPVLYIIILVVFVKKYMSRTLSLPACFCTFYAGMLFIWASFGDSPQNFARYALPLAGPLMILGIRAAAQAHKEQWARIIIIVLIAANLFNIALRFNFNDDDLIAHRGNQALFSWAKEHVSANERYMIWEPRTVALMTGRAGTTLAWIAARTPDQWHEALTQWGITYVMLNRTTDAAIIHEFSKAAWAQEAWNNGDDYVIFRIIK